MYIVAIAWLYVTVMMAVAEGSSSSGTILGAIITFILYGLFPVALVMYLMGTGSRRRALREREASVVDPDASGHATAAAEEPAVTSVREEK
jgi:hypothetical protein